MSYQVNFYQANECLISEFTIPPHFLLRCVSLMTPLAIGRPLYHANKVLINGLQLLLIDWHICCGLRGTELARTHKDLLRRKLNSSPLK